MCLCETLHLKRRFLFWWCAVEACQKIFSTATEVFLSRVLCVCSNRISQAKEILHFARKSVRANKVSSIQTYLDLKEALRIFQSIEVSHSKTSMNCRCNWKKMRKRRFLAWSSSLVLFLPRSLVIDRSREETDVYLRCVFFEKKNLEKGRKHKSRRVAFARKSEKKVIKTSTHSILDSDFKFSPSLSRFLVDYFFPFNLTNQSIIKSNYSIKLTR